MGVAEALLAVSLTYATFGKAYLLNPESVTYVVLVAALQGSGNALVTAADRKTILRTVLAPQTQFWFHVVFASTLYTISYSGAMSLDTVSGLFCIAACILYPVLMMIESPEDQENAVKMRTLGDPNAFLEEENAKRVYNETLFSLIAVRYDLGAVLMSFNQDSKWKKALVDALPDIARPYCLDVATGTGDIAALMADRYPRGTVEGSDLTAAMVDIARTRCHRDNITWSVQDMLDLKPARKADIITGSYCLRNSPNLLTSVHSFHSALKPGGTAAFLDFSKSTWYIHNLAQYYILSFWTGLIGLLLFGDPRSQNYIAESLWAYPNTAEMHEMFEQNGFEVADVQKFFFGCMELTVFRKL